MRFTIGHGAAAALMARVVVSSGAAQPNSTDWIELQAGGRSADLTASREQSPRTGRADALGVAVSSNEHWCMADPSARNEVELGGGFRAAITAGDLIAPPTVPTVDTRVVRWVNDPGGIAWRSLVGIGSNGPDEHAVVERRGPPYVQATARFQGCETRTTWHVGHAEVRLMATAACSALMVGALLCNAPAVPAPITLHGAPISGTVEVYRLAAPAVEPDDEKESSPERYFPKDRIRRGALIGGVIGCSIGAYLSRGNNDDAHAFNCLWVSGVGALFGMVVATAY